MRQGQVFKLRTIVLLVGGELSCTTIAGIEERQCISACVDGKTRLVCEEGRAPRAEQCPESSEVCAEPACNGGECGFRAAVGKPCGHGKLGACNEGYACLGPETQLSALLDHTCLVAQDGKVWCWGSNQFREIGDGTTEERGAPVMVQNLPGRALQVSVGYVHACALLEDRQVYCWGDNSGGQCGTGRGGQPLAVPTLVRAPAVRFTKVEAGARHTCAISEDESVYCWGNTTGGQCGVDPEDSGETTVGPTRVPHFDATSGAPPYLDRVVDIDTVKAHTCARRSAPPSMVCWGSNTYFERLTTSHALGPAAAELAFSPRPVPIDLPLDVVDIGMGFESTYAVTLNGEVFAWGWNERGQLGVESTDSFVPEPASVFLDAGRGPQRIIGAVEVLRSDGSHQCVRMGVAFAPHSSVLLGAPYLCWGANDRGELGLGDSSLGYQSFQFAMPARAVPDGAQNLVLGEDHACFTLSRDTSWDVYCYGSGGYVGNGSTGPDQAAQWSAERVLWDPTNFAPPSAGSP